MGRSACDHRNRQPQRTFLCSCPHSQDGQWFQLEAGLHYDWHRSYDPTIGCYTQPDPLGFIDGASVYGYVLEARCLKSTSMDDRVVLLLILVFRV